MSERRPRFIPLAGGAGPLTNAETGIVKAMRIDRRDPLVAISDYLSAAETALRQLMRSPNDQTARNTYNFAVGRIIATIRDAKLDPWTQPLRVPSFEDPLAVETVRVDGQIFLLAADFTAPLP